ncbi:MAG: ATP-binding protein [Anaerolineae bacterium]|nr:ATP-binding protein [Anaerolineae bacterium]
MLKHLSLIWKLTLSFMLVALTSAALVAIFIRFTTSDRLFGLIIEQQRSELQTTLTEYYSEHGSWQDVEQNWQKIWIDSLRQPTPNPETPDQQDPRKDPSRDRRRIFGLADADGVVLISLEPFFHKGETLSQETLNKGISITLNDQKIGTILTAPLEPRLTPEEDMFLQRTNQALLLAAIAAIVTALIIGILLARTLVTPLRSLTAAVQKMTSGELGQKVNVDSNDEIGILSQKFNQMSEEVARVNRQRRQMTADIAHDLRTPLTVIAGYIESMQDGVLQPTQERLALIYNEIERLQDLVSDLRTLSLADTGEISLHPQLFSPRYLLERALAPYQHRAEQQKVSLRLDIKEPVNAIKVDESRMMQIFSNLLSNALRYTSEDGEILLSAEQKGQVVEIAVKDTGEGILEENLPHIFERFYRADPSRYTETGETTGLGLAIVKALVEVQGGNIRAESTIGQGTAIYIQFKASDQVLEEQVED